MKPANFAPIYVGLYPELAEITRKHGYALAAHGSLSRDFDLICIPWVEKPSTPAEVIEEITSIFSLKLNQNKNPTIREHGRIVYTLILSFGECFLDFSFMPVQAVLQKPVGYTNFDELNIVDTENTLSCFSTKADAKFPISIYTDPVQPTFTPVRKKKKALLWNCRCGQVNIVATSRVIKSGYRKEYMCSACTEVFGFRQITRYVGK